MISRAPSLPQTPGYGDSSPLDCEVPMHYWDQARFAVVNGHRIALVHPIFECGQ